jgi:spore maturation protein CgeB
MNNVVICGVLDRIGSSNIWMASAFKNLGFNVIPINYRTLVEKHGMEFFGNMLVDTIKKYKPLLTIFCKFNGIHPDIVKDCAKYSMTWLFFMDSIAIAKLCPEIVEHSKYTYFSSCTSESAVQYFKECGAKSCYHVFEGINPKLHRPVDTNEKFRSEFSLLGSYTDDREKYVEFLRKNGFQVRTWGYGWPETNDPRAWSSICCSSDYILSINTFNNLPTYFSGRVFETLACAVPTFHYDPLDAVKTYFNEEDLILWKSEEELLRKIKRLKELDSISSEIIKPSMRIAMNGREKVLKNYTWTHSIIKMLKICGAI